MKNKFLFINSLAILSLFAACADDEIVDFRTEKPVSIAQYEYLNVYDVLKAYVDRSANPNFKLGIALGANDFIAGTQVHSLAVSNFDEMTAGNEMKYASCVSDNGSMNFSTVSNFVSAAQMAGVTIYGHTLAWHSQQNNKYLNSLIAPTVIPPDPSQESHYLLLHQDTKANPWDGQVYYTLPGGTTLAQGTEYTISFRAKTSATFNFQLWLMTSTNVDIKVNGGTAIGTEWATYSFKYTPETSDVNCVKLIVGELAGDFCVDDLKLVATGSEENLIQNGDFEQSDLSNWAKYSWHSVTYSIEGEAAAGAGYCLKFVNPTAQADNWAAQAWYELSEPFKSGVTYTFKCMVKATDAYNSSIFLQSTNGGNQEYMPEIVMGTTWSESSITFTPAGSGLDKFTFNFGNFAGTIYIDDVVLTEEGSTVNLIANSDFEAGHIDGWNSWAGYQSLSAEGEGYVAGEQIIEMTPEEKKDTLTWAMDNWIKGMMEATGGYVTTWDAVNEAISGTDADGDGYYDLQSASNGDPTTNFYWQDYLGNEDYVRIVVAKARQYFQEYGGNPSDLKLFINDYNLESWWDDGNKKAKSLVHWIETWESDGVTKIDGIGTQMHVTYILNEADQKAQEDAIVNMFQILAASGKLIKISELDMGICEKAFGTGLKTEEVTFEQQQKMAEFYTFIIRKYFEIIPVEQQYGITQWCATDSPADSGWRGGEPVGLWDINYNRKPTYEGFLKGLSGEE